MLYLGRGVYWFHQNRSDAKLYATGHYFVFRSCIFSVWTYDGESRFMASHDSIYGNERNNTYINGTKAYI